MLLCHLYPAKLAPHKLYQHVLFCPQFWCPPYYNVPLYYYYCWLLALFHYSVYQPIGGNLDSDRNHDSKIPYAKAGRR